MTKLNLDKPQANLEVESRYNMAGPSNKSLSKSLTLKELPSFLGNDANSVDDFRKIPSQYKLRTSTLETTTLRALIRARAKVTMTLAKVLKRRLELCLR